MYTVAILKGDFYTIILRVLGWECIPLCARFAPHPPTPSPMPAVEGLVYKISFFSKMNNNVPKIRKLVFSRGMCYGSCPVYDVSVLEDGSVEWLGKFFVEVIGPALWSIPISRVIEIEQALHHANFLSLNAAYTKYEVTCQASCDILVEYQDGFVKSVHHYHGDFSAPEALKNLENKLDESIETASYIGESSAKNL